MGALQSMSGNFTTDGLAGIVTADNITSNGLMPGLNGLPWLDMVAAFMRQPGDGGVGDRLSQNEVLAPDAVDCGIALRVPARAALLDVRYYGRRLHSIQARRDDIFYMLNDLVCSWQFITVPPGPPVVTPHGLGGVPDFVTCNPYVAGGNIDGVDWAVTTVNDTNIVVENWDLVETLTVTGILLRHHSIFSGPRQIVGPIPILLNGVGEVVAPHGLPGTPDFVAAFPYTGGGAVQPAGQMIMTTLPDADNLYFGLNAVGQQEIHAYAMITHSILR